MAQTMLQTIKDYDAKRQEIPGEHWLTLAAGVALFIATRRSSMLVSLAGSTVASMLVVRAATGRYGLERKPWMPLHGDRRVIDRRVG